MGFEFGQIRFQHGSNDTLYFAPSGYQIEEGRALQLLSMPTRPEDRKALVWIPMPVDRGVILINARSGKVATVPEL